MGGGGGGGGGGILMNNHSRVSNSQSYLIAEGSPPAHFLYISCRMPVVSIPKHTSELRAIHRCLYTRVRLALHVVNLSSMKVRDNR